MSTAKRRRGQSLHLELPNPDVEELPPVAAVFLILFDVKAGYTIAWKQSIPGLELNESVEYKSLPSGLHNVREDLIYFVHDNDYAGISAFLNEPAEEADRHALMLAVGALVPLSHGRLGKSWKHALSLKELAKTLVQDPTKTQILEDFWLAQKLPSEESSPDGVAKSPSDRQGKRREKHASPSSRTRTRNRAASTASALGQPGQPLSPHHPALSLPTFLDTFGPLVFPLYKAALLRKRILLVSQAPVELVCNFVYDISVLSSLTSSISDLLPLEPLPVRLRPLFAAGVHDMTTLAQGSRAINPNTEVTDDGVGYGWVACTTDDILSFKNHLFDTLVTIPPSYSKQAKEKIWPRIEVKKGTEVKATQRDLRRYRTLRRELRRFPSSHSPNASKHSGTEQDSDLPFENTQETYDDASSTLDAQLAEPQAWSALAYSSFMWWASAGEKRIDLDEEADHNAALLRHFAIHPGDSPERPRSARKSPGKSPGIEGMDTAPAGLEMTIIGYFHRLTTLILTTLSDIIDASDYSEDDGEDADADEDVAEDDGGQRENKKRSGGNPENADAVYVGSEDMSRMGLDIWSQSDRDFVRELVAFYFGRKADVRGGRVECCGVKIC